MPDPRTQQGDHVDEVLAQWAAAFPAADTAPVAVIARLGRVTAYVDAAVNERLARFGLTRASWDVLASLRRMGPPHRLSPTQLYVALMRTSGAMTHRVAPAHLDNERALLAALGDDERDALARLLRKLLVAFEREQPAPPPSGTGG